MSGWPSRLREVVGYGNHGRRWGGYFIFKLSCGHEEWREGSYAAKPKIGARMKCERCSRAAAFAKPVSGQAAGTG
jgi:hypothetical protein